MSSQVSFTFPEESAIARVLTGAPKDIGAFAVRRLLPAIEQRAVGPFVFIDYIEPAQLPSGVGLDVRPHPHIGLATITYLFQGEFTHRDTLGSNQVIRPGDVNWMVAGRGIAHSERTGAEVRTRGGPLHGVQTWVALPQTHEEVAPSFEHHPAPSLPVVERDGVKIRVIAGSAFGARANTGVLSPTLYAHAHFEAGASLVIDAEHEERAALVVAGSVTCSDHSFGDGSLIVLKPDRAAALRADVSADVLLLGGAKLDGHRHIWWNFVSSSRERIERAKQDWQSGAFGTVPGDEHEFIPLPE